MKDRIRADDSQPMTQTDLIDKMKEFHNARPKLFCRKVKFGNDEVEALLAVGLCFNENEVPEDCSTDLFGFR